MIHVYKLEIERDDPLTEEEMQEVIDSYVANGTWDLEYLGSREESEEWT